MKLSNSTIAFYFSLFLYGMLSIFFFAVLPGCATTPSKPQHVQGDNYVYTKRYMSHFIKEQMDEYDMTGVSVALVDGSKSNPVVWAQGFGYADKENKVPATANTMYRAGSVTKLFTATAIMQLAEKGKLDIDKPIQTYLPHITIRSRFAHAAPVTIRNMLTHHSGLPGNESNEMWGNAATDFSELANKTYDLAYAPNTQQAYSNLAFTLLGQVVENVSGMAYEDYIDYNVLIPAGMKKSNIDNNLSPAKDHAKGYFNGKNYALPALRDTPAGGLNTSVVELAKFAQTIFTNDHTANGRKLLSVNTLAMMQTAQFTSDSPFANNETGLAWMLSNEFNADNPKAGKITGHGGATMMFNTSFKTLPKHKLAVVVMANGLNEDGESTSEIADKMMQLALASKSGLRVKTDKPLPNKQSAAAIDLQRMSGKWVSGDLGVFDIKKKGNKLKLVIDDTEIDLVNRGGHTYYPEYKLLGMMSVDMGEFGKLGATYQTHGNQELLKISSPSSVYNAYAEKVTPQPLSSVSKVWQKRLGKYKAVKASGLFVPQDVVLVHENGVFALKMKVKDMFSHDYDEGQIFIKPIDDDRAVIYGIGRDTGEVVHFKTHADGHVRLYHSGYVYQK